MNQESPETPSSLGPIWSGLIAAAGMGIGSLVWGVLQGPAGLGPASYAGFAVGGACFTLLAAAMIRGSGSSS